MPFVITKEIVNVINQGGLETTEFFQKFVDEMCFAFQCLRKRATILVNTMRLVSSFLKIIKKFFLCLFR